MRTLPLLNKAFGIGVLVCASIASPARAVTTAATDPVGFTTLTASNKPSSAGTVNLISLNLTRPVTFQGAVASGGVSSNATGPTTITFSTALPTIALPSYLEIVGGANAGTVSDISSVTSTSVTLADNISGMAANVTSVKIRPHWTFATAFGVQSGASAFTGGTSGSDPNADIVTLLPAAPVNTPVSYYYNTAGNWRRVAGDADASGDVIPVSAGLQIQRLSSTPLSVVLVGAVKLGPTAIAVGGSSSQSSSAVTTLVSNPYPLASKRLDQIGLFNPNDSGAQSSFAAGASADDGDTLTILDPQTGILTDFYYDNSTSTYGNRWKSGFTDASLYVIPSGASATVTRKAGRNPFVWYAPQPNMSVDPNAAAPALALVSAVSRKVHNNGGLTSSGTSTTYSGDVNLPLPAAGTTGTESRNPDGSGNYTVVLGFSNPISSGTASVSGTGAASGGSTISGNELSIVVTGAANQQIISVGATNVTDVYGQALSSATVNVRLLRGDVNSNGTVNTADVNITKAQAGSSLTFGNFRSDVNGTGSFNTADVNIIKSLAGSSAP